MQLQAASVQVEIERNEIAARCAARVGRTIRGKYRLDRLLGVGGMGAVYAATHRNGRTFALKILHADTDRQARKSFLREAKIANRVDHEGAVPVIDEDVGEDRCPFLVLPLLHGETLRARVERSPTRRLELDETLCFAWLVLDVLSAAHAKSIVHRDIKPENLFVTAQCHLRVLDFGIARVLEGTDASVSRTGSITGTPAFMAPEQVLGRVSEIDARTDVWAVGATMFTLLSGEYAHEGATANEILVAAGSRPARNLADVAPEVPDSIRSLVQRALQFERSERWPTARAMQSQVEDACAVHFGRTIQEVLSVLRSDPSRLPPSRVTAAPPAHASDTERLAGASTRSLPRQAWWTKRSASIAMDPTRTMRVGEAIVGHPRLRRAALLVSGASLTATFIVAEVRLRLRGEVPVSTAVERTPAVVPYLGQWRTAWLDGDAPLIRAEAARACEANPNDARSHLAAVVATRFWPTPATRKHFVDAVRRRDQLTSRETAFLDAIAPGMTVPPDFVLASGRLRKLLDRDAEDVVLRLALADMQLRQGDLDGPRALLRPLVESTDAPGLALSRYAHLSALADDDETARIYFRRCLDSHPGAQVCAEPLVVLEMNDGKCAEAEQVLQRQLSVTPEPDAYRNLASTLQAQGAAAEEILPVLRNWVRASPEDQRDRNSIRADIGVALASGKLRDALSLYNHLGVSLHDVTDDVEQFDYTASRMALEAELGLHQAAVTTLAAYTRDRNSFQRDISGEDNVSYLQSLGAEMSVLPWSEWVTKRDHRLANPNEVDHQLDGMARSWLQHFAIPATDRSGAEEALSVFPAYLPLLHRSDRDFVQDAAVSRVYALVGRTSEAIPFAERAARSCAGLQDLVQFTRAQAEAADLLAKVGRVAEACRVYAGVLRRFPRSSGSVTAERVAASSKQVCSTSKNAIEFAGLW